MKLFEEEKSGFCSFSWIKDKNEIEILWLVQYIYMSIYSYTLDNTVSILFWKC